MKKEQKRMFLADNHFGEWIRTRMEAEKELSDRQHVFCVCGRLATGLHERNCAKFKNKVDSEAIKRMKHLIPKNWIARS